MAKTKRNIGQEIPDGIRQLKRGEHGRVANVPSVTRVREQTGLSQSKFALARGLGPNAAGMGARPTCTVRRGQDSLVDCSEEPGCAHRGRVKVAAPRTVT